MSHNVIAFHCSHCGEVLYVPEFLCGISGPCPHCGTMTTSPPRSQHPDAPPAESGNVTLLGGESKEALPDKARELVGVDPGKSADYYETIGEDWSSNPTLLEKWKMSWNDPPPPAGGSLPKRDKMPRLKPLGSAVPSTGQAWPTLEIRAAEEKPLPTEPVSLDGPDGMPPEEELPEQGDSPEAGGGDETNPPASHAPAKPPVKIRKAAGLSYFVPGPEEFATFAVSAKTGQPERKAVAEACSHVGLPMGSLLSLPVPDPSNDAVVDRGLAKLEWESRGVKVPAYDDGIIHDPAGWVALLAGNLPQETEGWAESSFGASWYFRGHESDAVELWQELGQWVVAFTGSGGELIHAQALTARNLDEDAADEIRLILSACQLRRGFQPTLVLVEGPCEADLPSLLGLPLETRVPGLNPPVTPSGGSFVPFSIRLLREEQDRARRKRRIITTAAVLGLLGCAGWAGWLGWRQQKAQLEEIRLSAVENSLVPVRSAMRQWSLMEPAIEPGGYPVEVFHQCLGLLKAGGIRLKTFELKETRVLITGEGSSVNAVLRLREDLKGAPVLQTFDWDFPQPRILPDGRAEFRAEGRKGGEE